MKAFPLLLTGLTFGVSPLLRAHLPPIDPKYKAEANPTAEYAKLYFNWPTLAANTTTNAPAIAAPFAAFNSKVSVHWDEKWLYVEAKGLPDHPLMVGIKSWQQQVPIPQTYTGENAWKIPLHPVPAKEPMSAKNHFLRGAVALAANGIPIFNALNNRGDDAYLFGELDEFGGHCGRADDYHYHIAPLHLEKLVGKGKPIAIALDGYPIYGLNEPDGSAVGKVDEFGGHETPALGYHYHASKKYPYINGGFHGQVTEIGGQVDPQPSASHVRREGAAFSQSPLRGALIKSFTASPDEKKFDLEYTLNGKALAVKYTHNDDNSWTFTYSRPDGTTITESYKPGERRAGGGGGPGGGADNGGKRPPRQGGGPRGGDPKGEPNNGNQGEVGPTGEQAKPGEAVDNTPDNNPRPPNDRPPGDRPPRGKGGKGGKGDKPGMIKPTMADTITLHVYADNWFIMYINGKLRVVDPIDYMPHNVVVADILPEYPMTIAVLAMDNADPKTGLEYGNHIGDGGLIIKFGDGTVTSAKWKAKNFFKGPLNRDVVNPKVQHDPIPPNWYAIDFDDSKWPQATEFTEERVGPKEHFYKYAEAFKGAKFIWSDDLDLDNTIIFRTKVEAPPGYKQRWTTHSEIDIREVTDIH
jgi:hypothetical protein